MQSFSSPTKTCEFVMTAQAPASNKSKVAPNPRATTKRAQKPKRDWRAYIIRLILFSAFWYLFGILAKMGVEAMEHHFTKVLPADQLLNMKVTLPMVMGVLAMTVTQFIAKKTGYDQ